MLIGLTGGIASGKSTVSAIFIKNNIPVIDADKIAREVVQPNQEAWAKIIKHFGQAILLPDQTINREKLGKIIFNDETQRKILNDITHPIIINEIKAKANKLLAFYNHVIVDIPLLFESKRESLFDLIIVVYVEEDVQLQRLMQRDNLTKDEALVRINTQMSLAEKKQRADIVIYNHQGIEETEKQVQAFIRLWTRKLD